MQYTVIIFTLVTAGISAALVYVAQYSRYSARIRSMGNAPAAAVSAVFLLFGLNVAFISNEVWGTTDKAKAAIASEGDVLRNMARVAQTIKAPIGRELQELLIGYEEYTVTEGWKLLTDGSGAYAEGGSLSKVALLVNSDEMAAATKPTIQGQLIAAATTLRAARNQRFALASGGLNPVKWTFTCFIDIIAILAIAFANLEQKSQHITAAALFFIVSTPTIGLLAWQANPFTGLAPVTAQPIEIALNHAKLALAAQKR